MFVLRDAQAPTEDAPVGLAVHAGRLEDVGATEPALAFDLLPGRARAQRAVLVEARGVPIDEHPVQCLGIAGGLLQDGLGHAAQQCHVAADARLQIQGAGPRRLEQGHVDELVRHDRAGRGGLHQRVDVHDVGAAAVRVGEGREHSGRVGGGVDAHDEQRVRAFPVLEARGALAGAQRCRQGAAAGLVAHVGTVRQVVRAQLTGHQLVEEGRLVAEPAGGVVGGLVRVVEFAQGPADQFEGVLPTDGDVVVRRGVVHHRLGQPALVLQREVAPPLQLGHRVGGEELRADPFAGHLPGDVLDAVLADVQVQALGVVRPRAPGAVEAAALVIHPHDGPGSVHHGALTQQEAGHTPGGAPARGGVPVGPKPRGLPGRGTHSGLDPVLRVLGGVHDDPLPTSGCGPAGAAGIAVDAGSADELSTLESRSAVWDRRPLTSARAYARPLARAGDPTRRDGGRRLAVAGSAVAGSCTGRAHRPGAGSREHRPRTRTAPRDPARRAVTVPAAPPVGPRPGGPATFPAGPLGRPPPDPRGRACRG